MKISVIWTGYVWLIQAVWLAKIWFNITALDVFEEKIEKLKSWIPIIYENWLEDLLKETLDKINFTTDLDEVVWSDIIFLCVWTPQDDEWKTDLWYLKKAVSDLKKKLSWNEIIVIKSTVPVWTNEMVYNLLDWNNSIVSNPEFLREWLAIDDFFNPDRVILWFKDWESEKVILKLKNVYRYFVEKNIEIVETNWQTAELIKYAANSFLATKITFINEIARLSDRVWADIKDVSRSMWLDPRIWWKFLNAWIWYWWSCFPKDVKSLIHQFKENDLSWDLISNVDYTNSTQADYFLEKILSKYWNNIHWKTFWVLWVAFKPGTDDLRESRGLVIIKKLIELWAFVNVFDYNEKALDNFEKYSYSLTTWIRSFVPISIKNNFSDLVNNVDSLIITVEDERVLVEDFSKLNLRDNLIFDWRNILDKKEIVEKWFDYIWIGY